MKFLSLTLLFVLYISIQGAQHAVLVSGSNGFWNYRHQADVCHAYQVLKEKGVPAENVILMSYNDAPYIKGYPFQGKLFNHPSTGAGIDVNDGCIIDYQGADVNVDNYLAILTGNRTNKTSGGNGRVLQSTEQDEVFLAFFDHGGPGIIGFPGMVPLYADDLISALKTMNQNNMYKQLVYYMEACNSGSMFQSILPSDLNVYAVTSASASQSSYACYCYGANDTVAGQEINTCLGDKFSVSWMENCDADNTAVETLAQQYQTVKGETTQSSVLQWGDNSFTSESVGTFVGGASTILRKLESSEKNFGQVQDSRDVYMHFLLNNFNKNPSQENFEELQNEMTKIKFFQDKFDQIQSTFELSGEFEETVITDFNCYRSLINRFQGNCGQINEKGMTHLKFFYELCQREDVNLDRTLEQIDIICA